MKIDKEILWVVVSGVAIFGPAAQQTANEIAKVFAKRVREEGWVE